MRKLTPSCEEEVSYSNIVKQGQNEQTVEEAIKMIISILENLDEARYSGTKEQKTEKTA